MNFEYISVLFLYEVTIILLQSAKKYQFYIINCIRVLFILFYWYKVILFVYNF